MPSQPSNICLVCSGPRLFLILYIRDNESYSVRGGVSQGSILGPLLFIKLPCFDIQSDIFTCLSVFDSPNAP